jgi:hypothetical protein
MTQGAWEGKHEVQQWDQYEGPFSLTWETNKHQVDTTINPQAPIHVGCYILHQGNGKGQGGSPNSTSNNKFCLSKIVT